jgi:1-acyl-sn-glycerol-3-phosphate acyltransferase
MIYRIAAFCIEVGVRQFFQRLNVTGEAPIKSGPVIIAANHPNQAVDSFLVGTTFHRPVSFLAKSTLFENRFLSVFFRSMRMIPVYRAMDKSDTSLNDQMFRDVVTKLHEGEAIAIFPEGTSSEQRRLLPLKTGVARIALQAEAEKNFEAGLKIQPVGLTYLSPRIFQSSVNVAIGEPITVKDFKARYETDPHNAVRELTAELEERLTRLTVTVPKLELQQDVERIVQLFDEESDLRERMQFIANVSSEISEVLPAETARIREEMELLSQLGFELGFFGIGSQAMISQRITKSQLVGGLVGRILHFVPYYLTRASVQLSVKDPHNLASVKIGYGVLWYGLWYLALLWTALSIGLSGFLSFAVVILIMVLGDRSNRFTEGAMIYLRHAWSQLVSGGAQKDSAEAAYHRRVDEFLARRETLRQRLLSLTDAYKAGTH